MKNKSFRAPGMLPTVAFARVVVEKPVGPTDDEIRVYAYHLYELSNREPGRDLANWLEAQSQWWARNSAGSQSAGGPRPLSAATNATAFSGPLSLDS